MYANRNVKPQKWNGPAKTGYTHSGVKPRTGEQRANIAERSVPFSTEPETDEYAVFCMKEMQKQLVVGVNTSRREDPPDGLQLGEDGKTKGIDDPFFYSGKDKYFIVVPEHFHDWFWANWKNARYAKKPVDAVGSDHLVQPVDESDAYTYKSFEAYSRQFSQGAFIKRDIDYAISVHSSHVIRANMQRVFFNSFEELCESRNRCNPLPFAKVVEEFNQKLLSKTHDKKEAVEMILKYIEHSHVHDPRKTAFENAIKIMFMYELQIGDEYNDAKDDILIAIKKACYTVSLPIMVVFNTATPDDILRNPFLDEKDVVGIWVRQLIVKSDGYTIPRKLLEKPMPERSPKC